MSNNITFICGNTYKNFVFDEKRTIFDVLSGQDLGGLKFDFPCGGKKTCKKCRIKIISGFEFVSEPNETEKKYLSEEDRKENIRYACMCEVCGDVTVELNPKEKIQIQTEGLQSIDTTPGRFKKITVVLSEPALENPISDEQNLIAALNSVGAIMNRPSVDIIKKLSAVKNKNREIDVILSVSNNREIKIIDVRKSGGCSDIYGAAVDIGTTTAAVYLYSLTTGNCIGIAAEENPQRTYGADVISRINYTIEHEHENENGLNHLKNLILSLIFKLIKNLCGENNIDSSDVYSVVLTGNTVMQHIAAGLPPKNIAFSPFTAATLFDFDVTRAELLQGTDIPGTFDLSKTDAVNDNAVIYFPPAFASYVGGDIATGLIASDTDLCDKLRIFLDIGTNGEIGLGNKNSFIFCATAAGPAFEGAHIKFGMAGIKGAINHIYLDELNNIKCETIGNTEPKGVCGSGIIDAVALMLELGVLDDTGRILEKDDVGDAHPGVPRYSENLCEIDGENAFVLNKKYNIYITQKDVREIQLAKASIAAGIMTLLDRAKKSVADVDEIILAGGFGARINKKSACKIGLIPEELKDKITVAGNTAGMGAAAVLLNQAAAERISKISGISKYIELSGDAFFMNEYVDRMMF